MAATDPATASAPLLRRWLLASEAEVARLRNIPDGARRELPRMESPEFAVPLLQSYEGAIAELKEQNAKLESENARLQRAVDATNGDQRVAAAAAQRAEFTTEEAEARVRSYRAEVEGLRHQLHTTEQELVAAREQAATRVGDDANRRDVASATAKAVEERDGIIARLHGELNRLRVEHEGLEATTEKLRQHAEDERVVLESTKVQQQLLQRENDDKLQEVDRVRNKMVLALKQAADNHTTHLRLIEEKHRAVVESLREEVRAHELSAAKFRAQLSKVEWSGPNSPASPAGGATSPTAVIESQMRQAQEIELRRLYAEVAAAQQSRDDATLKLEQQAATRRVEADETTRQLRHELEAAKARVRDLEERSQRLEHENERYKEQARVAREENRAANGEKLRLESEKAAKERALEEEQRARVQLTSQVAAAKQQADDALDNERRATRSVQRQLDAMTRDHQAHVDRSRDEVEDLQRQVESHRSAATDSGTRVKLLEAHLTEKERAIDACVSKAERLTQGLAAHRQQLVACDERLSQMAANEEANARELRGATLVVEQMKLENARLERERERLFAENRAIAKANKRRLAA